MDHDREQRHRSLAVRYEQQYASRGGLLVALVIKHADNLLRGFATALATGRHSLKPSLKPSLHGLSKATVLTTLLVERKA